MDFLVAVSEVTSETIEVEHRHHSLALDWYYAAGLSDLSPLPATLSTAPLLRQGVVLLHGMIFTHIQLDSFSLTTAKKVVASHEARYTDAMEW
jgi:hypothetical protein